MDDKEFKEIEQKSASIVEGNFDEDIYEVALLAKDVYDIPIKNTIVMIATFLTKLVMEDRITVVNKEAK